MGIQESGGDRASAKPLFESLEYHRFVLDHLPEFIVAARIDVSCSGDIAITFSSPAFLLGCLKSVLLALADIFVTILEFEYVCAATTGQPHGVYPAGRVRRVTVQV